MFETLQLLGAFVCTAILVLLGIGLLIAGGVRKPGKMASVGALCLLGAGMVLLLACWYAGKCDEDREAEVRRWHVAE